MIRRPLRPTFPVSMQADYLAALERARRFTVSFGSAQAFGSAALKKSNTLQEAIDGMAGELTGDPQHFHMKPPSYQSS